MNTAAAPSTQALLQRLQGLRHSLQDLQDPPRLLLGLELLWKLEEQLLLPAVPHAAAGVAVADTLREIELLRDLAAAVAQAGENTRPDRLIPVLEGWAMLHFARVDALLVSAADGAALLAETNALLERWRSEVKKQGEIEDEDRDPVGLRPR